MTRDVYARAGTVRSDLGPRPPRAVAGRARTAGFTVIASPTDGTTGDVAKLATLG